MVESTTKGSFKATFAVKVKTKTLRMSPDEKRIAREMHFDRKMRPTDIATALAMALTCAHKNIKATIRADPGQPRLQTAVGPESRENRQLWTQRTAETEGRTIQ